MANPIKAIRVPARRTKSVLQLSGADLTVGTEVMTALGPICVEDLKPGNLVVTKDMGLQKIRYVAFQDVDLRMYANKAPIKVAAGFLGLDTSGYFSPDAKFSVRHAMFDMMFGSSEVLVKCGDLSDHPGFEQIKNLRGITYVALGFAEHNIVTCNGAQVNLGASTQKTSRMILSAEEARLALQLLTPTRQPPEHQSFPLH